MHHSLQDDCKDTIEGKTVFICTYGWSNVHNEPIVCVSVTTPEGDSYLTQTLDTSGNKHTVDYMTEVALSAIEQCEKQFNCSCKLAVS